MKARVLAVQELTDRTVRRPFRRGMLSAVTTQAAVWGAIGDVHEIVFTVPDVSTRIDDFLGLDERNAANSVRADHVRN